MVAENTVSDLIERIKLEGQLTRNTGTNSIKALIEVSRDVRDKMDAQLDLISTNNSAITDFLQDAARSSQYGGPPADEGNGGGDDSGGGGGAPSGDGDGPLMKLGLLSTLAAAAIGGTIGVFKGWIDAIKFFTPAKILDALQSVSSSITKALTGFADMGKNVITSAKTAVFGALSPLNQFKDFFLKLAAPFTQAAKTVATLANSVFGVTTKVTDMFAYFKSFGSTISKISGVVGKLFLPLTIVMTAIDTVKGIIAGYTEGGIVGALEGAITGFFNSLIFGPLDLLKDLASWALGKLGFENAAETLDSFSFSELFSRFVSGIFDLGSGIISSLVGSFDNIYSEFATGDIMGGIGTYFTEAFTTLVTKPLDLVKDLVSWAADLFGFENASDWLDSFSITELFYSVVDWISAIPGKLVDAFEDFWIDTMEKFKIGFINFSNWVASIPDRIYLSALEYLNNSDVGDYLVSDDAVAGARAAVQSRQNDGADRVAQVQLEARDQRAQLAAQRVQEDAARLSAGGTTVAPTVMDNRTTVGPTNNVTNTTIVTTTNASSALSSYNQFQLNGVQ